MNKKILLGSIITVVILVLVSFTGVVGYQTTKSLTIARASPLFSIRTSRAIDEESKDLACDYVGKGEESVLSIPKRNDTKIEIEKVLDILTKIDDKTFNNFIKKIIQDKRVKDREIQTITKALFHLRNTYKEKQYTSDSPIFCFIWWLFDSIINFFYGLGLLLIIFFITIGVETILGYTCYPPYPPYCL